jgi:hypothetical protein
MAQIRFKNAKNATLYIYDITGKMLSSKMIKQSAGEDAIFVSNFQSGVYTLVLKSEQGVAVSKMIIK